eukprot:jgi/Hompol1/4040/HPOL_003462-RA
MVQSKTSYVPPKHPDDEFDPASIDFSDIEAKYQVKEPSGFANVVVVDNVPIVDESKEAKLVSVILKLFKNVGTVREGGIRLPKDAATGMSKGFMFIEFETAEQADLAIHQVNGYKLDKTHTLMLTKFDNIESYTKIPDEFVAPAAEEFVPKEHLKSWLTDRRARDQWVMFKGNEVGVYWNNKSEKPDLATLREGWSDYYVQWSPQGKYLVTVHNQGIALWGGPGWEKIMRFMHPKVKLVDFSPDESYMVTWSHDPFVNSEGQSHHVAFWDIATGQQLRTFASEPASAGAAAADNTRSAPAATVKVDWPMFKWSHDSKYFARMTTGQQSAISVYETPSMGLLDKKSFKIENLQSFEWSPSDNILSYWTPEIGNIPARVTLCKVPSREIVRTKNLFGVIDCKLFWQSAGDYLTVRVDRTKTKKQIQTSFEVFRMREKDIPVDVADHKLGEDVAGLYWEPAGTKFTVFATEGQKSTATFYQVQQQTPGAVVGSSNVGTKAVKTCDAKNVNQVFWSPKGRFCVFAGIYGTPGMQGDLQFWDTDDFSILSTGEHHLCTDIAWDPTGRYVVSSVSSWRAQGDSGVMLWTFSGQQLTAQSIKQLKQILWRPRPPTLLTPAQQKAIRKNLKDYAKQFDAEDAALNTQLSAEERVRRAALWREWTQYQLECIEQYEQELEYRIELFGFDPDKGREDDDTIEELEEWIEEIVDETEEIIG